MNAENQAKFNAICKAYNIGDSAAAAIQELISDMTDEAYQRGCDAEAYANAISTQS